MKVLFNILLTCIISASLLVGCTKYDDDYKAYLNDKEIVYPGVIQSPGYRAGNLRTQLVWNPSPDPSITKYIISWNNGASTMEVPATSHNPADLVSVVVPSLNEYVYAFTLVSVDNAGNKSVKKEINNVRVYGAAYISTLLNRGYNTSNPYEFLPNGDLRLNFNNKDTMNVSTTINYTNIAGAAATKQLAPNVNSVVIADYKLGTAIKYRSSYQPEPNSYDAFDVTQYADFPTIIKITECNKSLFSAMSLPGDNASAYGWVLSNLWNNRYYKSSSDNPDEGFHTGGATLPQSFTIDLGQAVQLDNFRLWQRDNAMFNVGNLKSFEVWGSNTAPNADGSWTGWSKLATFSSNKPSGLPAGQLTDTDRNYARAGEKFSFSAGMPQLRYLRFKVLATWGGANYVHLTELTFFKVN